MLRKFWNINQVPETELHVLLDKKIDSIYNKEDGSLISFIELPNGRIIPKTKMGFVNEQVDAVNVLTLKNKSILKFVKEMLDKGYSTMWEYVSFKNKIVLDYTGSNLILLRVRNNETGEYINIEDFRGKGFDVVNSEPIRDLTSMLSWAETTENVEGCVITFDDGFMVKLKTLWYFYRHRLNDRIEREDDVIAMTLEETIDDVKSQIDDSEKIAWVENIELIVKDFMTERVDEVLELVGKFNGDVKDFAIRYRKDKNFALAMNVINGKKVAYVAVKDWLLNETKRLEQARSFIKRKGFKRK